MLIGIGKVMQSSKSGSINGWKTKGVLEVTVWARPIWLWILQASLSTDQILL